MGWYPVDIAALVKWQKLGFAVLVQIYLRCFGDCGNQLMGLMVALMWSVVVAHHAAVTEPKPKKHKEQKE